MVMDFGLLGQAREAMDRNGVLFEMLLAKTANSVMSERHFSQFAREMRQMSPALRRMDPMFASMSDAEFEEARRGSSRTGMVFGASWVESKWRAVRRDAS